MGLKSLLKVAEGKNPANVSFEDKFIAAYSAAVQRKDKHESQGYPSDFFRPSSMYGCDRMLFFMRIHGGSDEEQADANLIEICDSGTDRHLRIQKIVSEMEGVKCLDLEDVVKEARQKGINTEFEGWNKDHTEARCKNADLSLYFQPDGVINFQGKDVILEIKTESTYQHANRYEPKEDHKYQVTCYGMGLGIDYVLFFYEDRNFCTKKAYLWKITDEMKAAVMNKVQRINAAIEAGVPPEKDESKCTYCKYKLECKAVDTGLWINPLLPPEKPIQAPTRRKKKKASNHTPKQKKPLTEAPTVATAKIKEAIQKSEAAYLAKIEHEADMEAIDARRDW